MAEVSQQTGPEFYDLADLVLNYPMPTHWGNLGYWRDIDIHAEDAYSQAGQALAELLAAKLELQPDDRLLDIGFGCGQQFEVWQQAGVGQIAGMNLSTSQLQLAQSQYPELELKQLEAEQLQRWVQVAALRPNKLVALDCAYHFSDKDAFLAAAAELLPQDGCLVLSDLVLGAEEPSWWQALLIKGFCRLARVPYHQWRKPEQIADDYLSKGFARCEIEDIGTHVLPRFGAWYRVFARRHASRLDFKCKLKFKLTACFLSFLSRYQLASYVVIRAQKE